jgi:hypothetical protein
MAAARDGSLQLGFGLGKYPNRGVIDAYAGISRGVEQITVRSSRRLALDPDRTVVGPIRYEVIEPLHSVRFVLEPNDCQPIAFDWTFEGVVPPSFEDRTHIRQGYRISAELVRYHQTGVGHGWIDIDGERTEFTPDTWVSTRDHSWGVRYGVGQAIPDLEPTIGLEGASYQFFWSPISMERSDGSRYALFFNYSSTQRPGLHHHELYAAVEHPDGSVDRIVEVVPHLTYQPVNRRLLGGRLDCTMADGSARPLTVEVVSDTGFHLGTGLYFGLDGHHHGEWRGELHVDGERIADCSDPDTARRIHQIRDTVIRVDDPVGGGRGWGNMQPVVSGAFPDLGLSADDSFI